MQREGPGPDCVDRSVPHRGNGNAMALSGASLMGLRNTKKVGGENSVVSGEDVTRQWPEPTSCTSLGDGGKDVRLPKQMGWLQKGQS